MTTIYLRLLFQSTLPLREVTRRTRRIHGNLRISIHTSLAGSDLRSLVPNAVFVRFQSTLPLREVTRGPRGIPCRPRISIHTSLAGSDVRHASVTGERAISIHTSLAGSDDCKGYRTDVYRLFQSTLPLREVTHTRLHRNDPKHISIHTSLAGSDSLFWC